MPRFKPIPASLMARAILPHPTGGVWDADTALATVARGPRMFTFRRGGTNKGRAILVSRDNGSWSRPVTESSETLRRLTGDTRYALVVAGETPSMARFVASRVTRGDAPREVFRQTLRALYMLDSPNPQPE